jgi:hypothetical protein
MSKDKKSISLEKLEKDYKELMKESVEFPYTAPATPQIISSTDMFVKFSLYTQSDMTITTINTLGA